jgi:thiol-disulfide isomerase/thioredoxin
VSRKPKTGNRLTGGGLAVLCATVAISLAAGDKRKEHASRIAGEIDGRGFAELVARERGRVLLVNFWATWCGPCRAEFPDLSRLSSAYRSRGLEVVGISTDFESQRAAVERFLDAQRPSFDNYHKARGDDEVFINAVDADWGGELPFTLIYDRQGRRSAAISGERTFAEYEKEIRPLLGIGQKP